MFRHLAIRREGPVEYVTLNRPEVRNALNGDVIREVTEWAEGVGTRATAPRAVVLAGSGPVFCGGADIAWMASTIDFSEDENVRDAEATSLMFSRLNEAPVPIVGRIHGAALGGGAGLAAVCDIVVAEEHAVFGFTEVKLGIVPAVISPFVLQKIGRSAARELFLTGMRFSAVRAREIGLVHAVVPAAALDDAVAGYVRELCSAGPEAVAHAKRLIDEVPGRPLEDARLLTARAIAKRRTSAEGQEGLRAFLEKRPPGWRSRNS